MALSLVFNFRNLFPDKKMSLILKLQREAFWTESLLRPSNSDMPVVHLRGCDVAGPHVDVVVPVALLVAVSPLVNECFSPNQLSVYLSPIIILPSVSSKDLKAVAEILVTGKTSDGDVSRLKAIEEVFRMLGAVASLQMEMCSGEADQFKELKGNG